MISIVIVNLNNCEGLEKTLRSISNLVDLSYFDKVILKDGGSTDNSYTIFKNFQNTSPIAETVYDDRTDGSIFEAMNMGLEHVKTPYVVMMNSGDSFRRNFRVSEVAPLLDDGCDAIFFGYVNQGDVRLPALDFSKMNLVSFCHQAMIIRSDIRYNTRWTASADLELVIMVVSKKRFKILNTIMAEYEGGGISSVKSIGRSILLSFWTLKYLGSIVFIFSIYNRILAKLYRLFGHPLKNKL